ncbi:MAG: ribonuclease domain-containing protein [Tetrasphaera sp.]
MGHRKADRQLVVLVGVALCVALLWWGFGRDSGGTATPQPSHSAVWVPSSGTPGTSGPGSATSTSTASASPKTASTTTSAPGSATRQSATPESGLATIAESQLPAEAQRTLALIRAGGPYPYAADDDVFENRERILPRRQRGYYREYTVQTPGSDDRGARRIVSGADADRYYTDDHYDSFRQIEEGQ